MSLSAAPTRRWPSPTVPNMVPTSGQSVQMSVYWWTETRNGQKWSSNPRENSLSSPYKSVHGRSYVVWLEVHVKTWNKDPTWFHYTKHWRHLITLRISKTENIESKGFHLGNTMGFQRNIFTTCCLPKYRFCFLISPNYVTCQASIAA